MNATLSKFDPRGPIVPRGRPRKPLPELLAKYKVSASGCWEWTGTRNKQGYGVIGLYLDGAPCGIPAPRLQWMHCHGEIPAGCVIMHTCDNPPCVNPDHLAAGTQAANLTDMRAKGRADTESGGRALQAFHDKVRRGEAVYTPHLGTKKKAATP